MRKMLFLVFLPAFLPAFSQQADTTYFSKKGLSCQADTAYYYQVETVADRIKTIKAYFTSNQQLKQEGKEEMLSDRNVKTGRWRWFYENGQLQKEETYDLGVKTGISKEWYESGQEKAEWTHRQGEGWLDAFWAEDGREMVVKGDGKFETFYPDSTSNSLAPAGRAMKEQGNIKKGRQDGLWKAWHANGQLMHQVMIVRGEKEGTESIWASNGQKIYEATHLPGAGGTATFWDESGAFIVERNTLPPAKINWVKMGNCEPFPLNVDEVRQKIGYPGVARAAGIEGEVIVRPLIDKKGHVEQVKWIKKAHPILAEAVAEHLGQLKLTPAIVAGKYLKFWVNIPFRFELLVDQEVERKKKKRKRKK